MTGKTRWTKGRKRLAATLVIGLAGWVWGLMLWQLNLGLGLRTAAFDLPFQLDDLSFPSRQHSPPEDIVLIYLDEDSHTQLEQPLAQPWDRRLHARLVEHLTKEGARMIVFDILFHDENPEEDKAFADAIRKHGNVVLAGELVRTKSEVDERASLLLAAPDLRRAAAGWGLTVVPIDSDGVARRIAHSVPTDFGDKPSLSEFVRQRATGAEPKVGGGAELINFYGPAGTFASYSYAGVLKDEWIPEGVFRNKIVIVGARQNSGLSDSGKDVFSTPYTQVLTEDRDEKKSRLLTPGMEIHATAIANLLQNRRIVSLPDDQEGWVIVLVALSLSAASCLLPPVRGAAICLATGLGIALFGILEQLHEGFHFLWTIPAFGQMPLIAGMSLGAHYLIEYSARWKLRRAFRSYMSDEQARQIDEDEVSLELGGKEVDVTILFSDLAGFTTMSEGLPPQSVSKALIAYFETATEGILDNRGTIIKYIGDAVMATWGAPLKVDREADRAIDAAIQMQLASARPISLDTPEGTTEHVLETRVGINSGPAIAGNLGSRRRFDYTLIGDTTNTAARLEGLNKMLGTSILVSEAVLTKCVEPAKFLIRRMGGFIVKGKKRGVVVFEIMGYSDHPAEAVRNRSAEYLRIYQEGIAAFGTGDLTRATTCFSQSLTLHDRLPECPASRLHLDAIAAFDAGPSDMEEWRGEIVLDSK